MSTNTENFDISIGGYEGVYCSYCRKKIVMNDDYSLLCDCALAQEELKIRDKIIKGKVELQELKQTTEHIREKNQLTIYNTALELEQVSVGKRLEELTSQEKQEDTVESTDHK